MKFITVRKSFVNQKAPAENILGMKADLSSAWFRTETSIGAAAPSERCTVLGPCAHLLHRKTI